MAYYPCLQELNQLEDMENLSQTEDAEKKVRVQTEKHKELGWKMSWKKMED